MTIFKKIKRVMDGWGISEKPRDILREVRSYDTIILNFLRQTVSGTPGKSSPAEFQRKAIQREWKRRKNALHEMQAEAERLKLD